MSENKGNRRPLDTEELTDAQMQAVSGGNDGSEKIVKQLPRKFRLNSAFVKVSDGLAPDSRRFRYNSAFVNVSDREK